MGAARLKRIVFASALLCLCAVEAHDGPHAAGEEHAEAGAAVSGGVQRLADGSLQVPTSLQQLLGLRTVAWTGQAAPRVLLAEVQPQPEAGVQLTASTAGTLEAPASGWLLPGARIARGQVLAWIRPAMRQQDRARRQAQRAEIVQRLAIASLNVERLRLQSAVVPEGGVATGNVYFEQMLAEEAGYKAQLAELSAGLAARVSVAAGSAGTLLASPLRAGDVVAAGSVVFRLHDAQRLRLVAQVPEPLLAGALPVATLGTRPLVFRGQQPLDDGTGWALAFDLEGESTLQPGQLVEISLAGSGAARWPRGACQRGLDGRGTLWLQNGERFQRVAVADCQQPATAPVDARLVVEGASLLAAY